MNADLWSRHDAVLGEGPFWQSEKRRLLWVDIARGQVLASTPEKTEVLVTLPGRASLAIPREGGGLVVAGNTDLVLFDSEGNAEGIEVEEADVGRCLNDGACDPSGRLWVGSAVLDGEQASAGLFRVDGRGAARLVSGSSMSNGIGWSPDGSRLYYVDTERKELSVFAFDAQCGTLADRSSLATFTDGLPDGLAVDRDGHIWLALWGAARVVCLDESGARQGEIGLPVRNVTSCAFGGIGYRDLFITTAQQDGESLEPLAGSIFCVPDLADGLPSSLARF